MKMSKDSSAKYTKITKKDYKKKICERYQSLSKVEKKKKKKKNKNTVANNIKDSQDENRR